MDPPAWLFDPRAPSREPPAIPHKTIVCKRSAYRLRSGERVVIYGDAEQYLPLLLVADFAASFFMLVKRWTVLPLDAFRKKHDKERLR